MNLFLEAGTSGESSVAMFVLNVRVIMCKGWEELWSFLNRRDAGHKRAGSEQGWCVTGHKYLSELHNRVEACVAILLLGHTFLGPNILLASSSYAERFGFNSFSICRFLIGSHADRTAHSNRPNGQQYSGL